MVCPSSLMISCLWSSTCQASVSYTCLARRSFPQPSLRSSPSPLRSSKLKEVRPANHDIIQCAPPCLGLLPSMWSLKCSFSPLPSCSDRVFVGAACGPGQIEAASLARCFQLTSEALSDALRAAACPTSRLRTIALSHLDLSSWPPPPPADDVSIPHDEDEASGRPLQTALPVDAFPPVGRLKV